MIVNDSNPELQRYESLRAGRKHAPGIQCMVLYPQAGVLQFAGGRCFSRFNSVFSTRDEQLRISVAARRMLRNPQPKGSNWASAASFPQDDRSLAAGGESDAVIRRTGCQVFCSASQCSPFRYFSVADKGSRGLRCDFRKQTWRGSTDGPNDGSSIHCDEIGG